MPRDNIVREEKSRLTHDDRKEDRRDNKEKENERERVAVHLTKNVEKGQRFIMKYT